MSEHAILALGSIVMAGLTMAIGAVGAAFGESRIGAAAICPSASTYFCATK